LADSGKTLFIEYAGTARMKPHLNARLDLPKYARYLSYKKLFEYLTQAATTPIRIPARRRRSDRELPKAA
jgi:hypothetical protein